MIDPGRAFGTGAHATTRLCLELLLELEAPEGSFVDLGCGSGVLAITAAKLGFGPVLALDIRPARPWRPPARTLSATASRSRSGGSTCEPSPSPGAAPLPPTCSRPLLLELGSPGRGGAAPSG